MALPIRFVVVSLPASIKVFTIGRTSEVSSDFPSTFAVAKDVIKSSLGSSLLFSTVDSKCLFASTKDFATLRRAL